MATVKETPSAPAGATPQRRRKRPFRRGESLLAAAILLAALLPLAAAPGGDPGDAATAGAPPPIGFIIPTMDDSWWLRLWLGAERSATEGGFTLLRSEARSARKVIGNLRDFHKTGGKVVIVGLAEVRKGGEILDECRRLGLKIYAIGNRFEEEDGRIIPDVPFCGIDARGAGRDIGRALLDEARRRGWASDGILVMALRSEHSAAATDIAGAMLDSLVEGGVSRDRIMDILLPSPDYIGTMAAAGRAADARPDARRWLVGGSEDAAVIGAVRALEERGYDQDSIIAVGVNGGFDAQYEFENPHPTGFIASLRLSGVAQGRRLADRAFRWAEEGVEPPLAELLAGSFITRDNYVIEIKLLHDPQGDTHAGEDAKRKGGGK